MSNEFTERGARFASKITTGPDSFVVSNQPIEKQPAYSCRIRVRRLSDGFDLWQRGTGSDPYKAWVDAWERARVRLVPNDPNPGFATKIMEGTFLSLQIFHDAGLVVS